MSQKRDVVLDKHFCPLVRVYVKRGEQDFQGSTSSTEIVRFLGQGCFLRYSWHQSCLEFLGCILMQGIIFCMQLLMTVYY